MTLNVAVAEIDSITTKEQDYAILAFLEKRFFAIILTGFA